MLNSKKIFHCAFLVLAVAFNGCSATGSYNSFKTDRKILVGDGIREAFRYEGLERHPVIVIPGIFGSRLVDPGSKRIVWGLFTGKEMIENFSSKQIQLLSYPMEEGKSLCELWDGVVPAGVLDKVKVKLLGLPIYVNGYKDMIDANSTDEPKVIVKTILKFSSQISTLAPIINFLFHLKKRKLS